MEHIDRQLDRHLRANHGVIGRSDVLRLGGSDNLIRNRVRRGAWIRRHRNTYLLAGAPPSPIQDLSAALTAVPGAVASHLTAAWLLNLIAEAPDHPHLTIVGDPPRMVGVVVHRCTVAPPLLRMRGFPCTTATRTLVDVAAIAGPGLLTAVVDQALALRQTAIPHLNLALQTAERARPGAKALRQHLEARGMSATPEPSVLESRMDRLMQRSGVPPVVAQHCVAGGRYRLDYAWPAVRLAVEVKGYAWHSSPESLRADSARERELTQMGWTVLTFTWDDVTNRPQQVAEAIVAAHRRLSARQTSGL